MPGTLLSASGKDPNWLISITVRTMWPLINCVYEARSNILQRLMMPRNVIHFPALNIVHRRIPITQMVNRLIHSEVKRWYFFPAVRFLKDILRDLLLWELTAANPLTTSSTFHPSKNVKPITKRVCRLKIVSENTFIYNCDLQENCCCCSNRPQGGTQST